MIHRITYVLPVHNEASILRRSVGALVERLEAFPEAEIIMVENGSSDDSAQLIRQIAADSTSTRIKAIDAYSPTGFGNAYREGLRLSTGDLVVLSAADLPFGFSDLDSYLALGPPSHLVIGSKGHPESDVKVKSVRRAASFVFRLLRSMLLGMKVRDSQGTILVDGQLARGLLPLLTSSDYFVSTEMIALAQTLGVVPVEVPIDYRDARPDSRVRPLRDGLRMLRQLLRLRRRLRAIAGIEEHPPAAAAT